MHSYDFREEDVVDFYINFLKSLSQRIKGVPTRLFFNEVACFALLEISDDLSIRNTAISHCYLKLYGSIIIEIL